MASKHYFKVGTKVSARKQLSNGSIEVQTRLHPSPLNDSISIVFSLPTVYVREIQLNYKEASALHKLLGNYLEIERRNEL